MNDDAIRSAPWPNSIPAPGGDRVAGGAARTGSWIVRAPDVAAVRRHVIGAATHAGLDTQRADQFTLAVNEVVINAIRHGGGTATVTLAASEPTVDRDGAIIVTVTDSGPGFRHDTAPELPPADQINGRGLWLVRRMCDDVVIDSSPRGTAVRLRATAAQR